MVVAFGSVLERNIFGPGKPVVEGNNKARGMLGRRRAPSCFAGWLVASQLFLTQTTKIAPLAVAGERELVALKLMVLLMSSPLRQ